MYLVRWDRDNHCKYKAFLSWNKKKREFLCRVCQIDEHPAWVALHRKKKLISNTSSIDFDDVSRVILVISNALMIIWSSMILIFVLLHPLEKFNHFVLLSSHLHQVSGRIRCTIIIQLSMNKEVKASNRLDLFLAWTAVFCLIIGSTFECVCELY